MKLIILKINTPFLFLRVAFFILLSFNLQTTSYADNFSQGSIRVAMVSKLFNSDEWIAIEDIKEVKIGITTDDKPLKKFSEKRGQMRNEKASIVALMPEQDDGVTDIENHLELDRLIDINVPIDPEILAKYEKQTKLRSEDSIKKVQKIDTYFRTRAMPLFGKGIKFVLAAEKYGIDWNLLPAIAVRESSGGKQPCGNNPFGWGDCKMNNFRSYDEAIEIVSSHLSGSKESTARYYAGKTTAEKLHNYNGKVVPTYSSEVLAIMKVIHNTKPN